MEKVVFATQEIIEKQRDVANVSYSRNMNVLNILFSHCGVNDIVEFRPTTWKVIALLFPAIEEIAFDCERGIMIYDIGRKTWRSADDVK